MIFSVEKTTHEDEILISKEMDIYCFFTAKNSIILPISTLKLAILASLKQKKEVLLLKKSGPLPTISKNLQWDGGDHWLWLPARTASLISKAWDNSELETASLDLLISKLKSLK